MCAVASILNLIAVAAKHDLLSIEAEHWESIKPLIPTNLCLSISIKVCEVHIKRKATLVFMITAENQVLAIGRKIGCPVCLFKKCDLPRIAAVCVCNPDFHVGWSHQVVGEKFAVFFRFYINNGTACTPYDFTSRVLVTCLIFVPSRFMV